MSQARHVGNLFTLSSPPPSARHPRQPTRSGRQYRGLESAFLDVRSHFSLHTSRLIHPLPFWLVWFFKAARISRLILRSERFVRMICAVRFIWLRNKPMRSLIKMMENCWCSEVCLRVKSSRPGRSACVGYAIFRPLISKLTVALTKYYDWITNFGNAILLLRAVKECFNDKTVLLLQRKS